MQCWLEAATDDVLSLYADTAVRHVAAFPPLVGKDEIARGLRTALNGRDLEVRAIHESGEWATLEWRHGEGIGCSVFRVVDGLIVEHREYWDRASFFFRSVRT